MAPRREKTRPRPPWRIGIDTGGTFTDLFALGPRQRVALKVPSTPEDPAAAVAHALHELKRRVPELPDSDLFLVHGSTVVTNALLEGKVGRVVFVTNAGFEDLIEIGRQAREELYALSPGRPEPLVARADRIGVRERTLADGSRLEQPSARELRALVTAVRRRRADAVAIGLLHAYASPKAEQELARVLRPLGIPTSCSSEVAPLFREFERYSTTVANAALLPVVARYTARLRRILPGHELAVVQSNGGLTSVEEVSRLPVRMVLSGPAGGVQAAEATLRTLRRSRAVTFDMGGTSTDVGLILKEAHRVEQTSVGGRPLLVDSMDVHTIGAGGGSILWIDPGGSLRAGPQSAGADPGPACYGRGHEACITDAHVFLGRFPARDKLGGTIELQPARSRTALARLAAALHTSPRHLAAAALEIVDAAMEKAIHRISLERGHDPRDFALFSFGGAGGLHACRLARRLGIREVIVPPEPGATSAFGMAVCDARVDVSQGWIRRLDAVTDAQLRVRFRRLQEGARRRLFRAQGPGAVQFEASVACRYVGQSYEIRLPFAPGFRKRFEQEHERQNGFRLPGHALECVALHCTAVRRHRSPAPHAVRLRRGTPVAVDSVPAHFLRPDGRSRRGILPVFRRPDLAPGTRLRGPAILVESTATTLLEAGYDGTVDATGCLLLSRPSRR